MMDSLGGSSVLGCNTNNATQAQNNQNARRRTLQMAVCYLLTEAGFQNADRYALETLCEMIQAFIVQVGESSRGLCELAGRTNPVVGDVALALINMGVSSIGGGLEEHAKRSGARAISAPVPAPAPRQLPTLQAGSKLPHPPHVPDYLPPLPDAHAYIRTPTHKQPVTEYEAIREKAAQQKLDVERALTKFVAKTSEQQSLFATSDNNNMFPLIAPKNTTSGTGLSNLLSALLPRDQVFDPEDLELPPSPVRNQQSRSSDQKSTTAANDSADGGNDDDSQEQQSADGDNQQPSIKSEMDIIDNPYLRPVKMPRKLK